MRVLVACEFSGAVRRAFALKGHDAWSCDILPAEDAGPGSHHVGDVLPLLAGQWDMMIAHPPCTYLSRSGWHWVNAPDHDTHPLKGEPRRQAAKAAADFFRSLLDAPIPRICIENPRPISHAKLPPHTQVIQPWEYGHGEVKTTCLWLKGLPPLKPTKVVAGREQRIWKMSPGKDRGKERSRTYPGIATAMAEQWGAVSAGGGTP